MLLASICWKFYYGLESGDVTKHDQGSKTMATPCIKYGLAMGATKKKLEICN